MSASVACDTLLVLSLMLDGVIGTVCEAETEDIGVLTLSMVVERPCDSPMLVIRVVRSTVEASVMCDTLFVLSLVLDRVVVTVCGAAVEGTRVLTASVVVE